MKAASRHSEKLHNRVLLSLDPEARDFLKQRMEIQPLEAGSVLYDEGAPVTRVIFPHLGVVSIMGRLPDGAVVEKASMGNEGFVGVACLVGGTEIFGRTVVQIPGYASSLALADLQVAMDRFAGIREIMLQFARRLIVHLMETVACSSVHDAERRISSWLLHADDRMLGGEFPFTQEALARLLGLRRATVSEIYCELARAGLISYARGMVSIADKRGLRQRACECYDRILSAGVQPRPAEPRRPSGVAQEGGGNICRGQRG